MRGGRQGFLQHRQADRFIAIEPPSRLGAGKAGDFVCRMENGGVGILKEAGKDVWLIARAMELLPLGEIDRSRKEVRFENGGEELEKTARG